ncbi:hypothetical protein MMC16_007391 [Acarospora aff. strigata]|nr:hypothetical protein [Acarospora aff. strigata]
MEFHNSGNGVEQRFQHAAFPGSSAPQRASNSQRADDPQFDIFDWYPKYQSCQRYFLEHAQHSGPIQAVTAFININLPFQRASNPPDSLPATHLPALAGMAGSRAPHLRQGTTPSSLYPPPAYHISLIPYLRRLIVTGLDFPGVLHGFFGDDWAAGVGSLHEQERRNYLFAAKSGGWASVKKDYDMLPFESVPFLRPLQGPLDAEIDAAEKTWSEWLAMEDWMVGSRAPESMSEGSQSRNRPMR